MPKSYKGQQKHNYFLASLSWIFWTFKLEPLAAFSILPPPINVLQWCMWPWHGLKCSRHLLGLESHGIMLPMLIITKLHSPSLLLTTTSIALCGYQSHHFCFFLVIAPHKGRPAVFSLPPKISPVKMPLAPYMMKQKIKNLESVWELRTERVGPRSWFFGCFSVFLSLY